MMKLLLPLALLAAFASAQDEKPALPPAEAPAAAPAAAAPAAAAPAAPATEVSDTPAAPAAEEAKKEAPKEEPKKEEPKPEPKADPKPEPKAEPKKDGEGAVSPSPAKAARVAGPEEEYAFAKAAAEDADADIAEAAMADLELFARRYPESPLAPEALLQLAGLRQKKGDWQPAMTTLLRLLYEYPSTKVGLRAKSDFLTLVDKKASRKQRQLLADLVKVPETGEKADRLFYVWNKLVDDAPDALYEPVAAEIRDFMVRFPGHKSSDRLQAQLARLHSVNGKPEAALLACRKLLALYPDSGLRSKAQLFVGDIYAESLRDPKKAIDAYQELALQYPGAPELLPSLQKSASLFEDKLKQYDLAVEMHEKVVAGFPKTAASLAALKSIAKLQRDRLAKPADAVKTLTKLSSMHGGQDGVDALLQAADWSRRDLKDMQRQAELLRKVADDYAAAKEAPQALFDSAAVYEADLKDNAKALEIYKEVESKFPSNRVAKKAADKAAKLAAAQ